MQMTVAERVFHSVLFEIGAMLITAIAVLFAGNIAITAALGVGIAISLVAVCWNFLFNIGFDRIFTGRRENRSLGIRLLHTACFEGGLLLFTLPLIAYALDLTLWHAFIADIAITLVIMVYTLIFNWIYDYVRLYFVQG